MAMHIIRGDYEEPVKEKKVPLHKQLDYLQTLKLGFIDHHNKQLKKRKAI